MAKIGTLNTFVPSTKALSSDVNANFDDIKTSVNVAYDEIDTINTSIITLDSEVIKKDGSVDFTAVQSYPKLTITGITKANPAVVTIADHTFANGDKIYISSVVGMTEINGQSYTVANKADDTFELSGVDSSSYTTYTSGGYAYLLPKDNENLANKVYVDDKVTTSYADLVQPGYVPYSVNSGLTSINKVSDTEVSFTGTPTVTFPNGKTYTGLTLSNVTGISADGTYDLIIEEDDISGSTVTPKAVLSSTITETTANGTGGNDGDRNLNINVRPMYPERKISGIWTHKEFVKIGGFVKTSRTLGTPYVYAFNGKYVGTPILLAGGTFTISHNIGSLCTATVHICTVANGKINNLSQPLRRNDLGNDNDAYDTIIYAINSLTASCQFPGGNDGNNSIYIPPLSAPAFGSNYFIVIVERVF